MNKEILLQQSINSKLDLAGPLCYKNSCRFNCILYKGPTLTHTGN